MKKSSQKMKKVPFLLQILARNPVLQFIKFQKGLSNSDVLEIGDRDDAKINAERFQRLWEQEIENCKAANLKKVGEEKIRPSLTNVVWRFARTRLIVCFILIIFSMLLQFIVPVQYFSFLKC